MPSSVDSLEKCQPDDFKRQVKPLMSNAKQKKLGLIAALLTVLIWSAYFISLRLGVRSNIAVNELMLFRYAIPGLILLPLFILRRRKIFSVSPVYLMGMMIGAGIPFFFLSAKGMGWAHVAQGSTLIPGVAPLFITMMAVLIFKEAMTSWRKIGLFVIGFGVLLIVSVGWVSPSPDLYKGQMIYLLASLFWAVFTVSVRLSGLNPIEATAVVAVPSGLVSVLLLFIFPSTLLASPLPAWEFWTQVAVQGFAVGLFSSVLYGYAIMRLGAELTSAVGALTPVVASMMAYFIFVDHVDLLTAIGMLCVAWGVVMVGGLLKSVSMRNVGILKSVKPSPASLS